MLFQTLQRDKKNSFFKQEKFKLINHSNYRWSSLWCKTSQKTCEEGENWNPSSEDGAGGVTLMKALNKHLAMRI